MYQIILLAPIIIKKNAWSGGNGASDRQDLIGSRTSEAYGGDDEMLGADI